ncbi:MAG: hypothetical protein KAI47_11565 [Deltaproteobacteria bacterium]|nr:hypothetical protein [Deltaproteobacteria bacterium]
MTETGEDFVTMYIFLGDSGVSRPHGELIAFLPAVARDLGWEICTEADAERRWRAGPAARWVSLSDSALDAESLDLRATTSPLAQKISARWPVAVVRRSAGVLTFLLYRDGDFVDHYANRALPGEDTGGGDETPGRGSDPSRWADLLGTPRNAMRLETVWGSWSDADEVLSRTAAIVGWDVDSVLDAPGSSTLALRRGSRSED